ncbi:GDCCVxC domain-containing (seleno)protein [Leisingera sp. ANG59]|uniref:GDCCVxC domain-containing (seleno)protein n=1 Tax=Leisingera sp. ANG59 TaxID=2675221 RepID=UPI001573C56F|nr:GDCCVxC domain-containing (seleno)protein [Leisingera sp. ANG59]NSY39436.1 hypothetical protein [Leisingera sp. ANG59]
MPDEQAAQVVLTSILTCPGCGRETTEEMPQDACQWFYECPACRALLRPKPGDCCVFCSYGTAPCPPVQKGDCCCG